MDSAVPPRHPKRIMFCLLVLHSTTNSFSFQFSWTSESKNNNQCKIKILFSKQLVPVWISSAAKSKVHWHYDSKRDESNARVISFRVPFPHLHHLGASCMLVNWPKQAQMVTGTCDFWLFSVLMRWCRSKKLHSSLSSNGQPKQNIHQEYMQFI